jgi:hypothetical protein
VKSRIDKRSFHSHFLLTRGMGEHRIPPLTGQAPKSSRAQFDLSGKSVFQAQVLQTAMETLRGW